MKHREADSYGAYGEASGMHTGMHVGRSVGRKGGRGGGIAGAAAAAQHAKRKVSQDDGCVRRKGKVSRVRSWRACRVG